MFSIQKKKMKRKIQNNIMQINLACADASEEGCPLRPKPCSSSVSEATESASSFCSLMPMLPGCCSVPSVVQFLDSVSVPTDKNKQDQWNSGWQSTPVENIMQVINDQKLYILLSKHMLFLTFTTNVILLLRFTKRFRATHSLLFWITSTFFLSLSTKKMCKWQFYFGIFSSKSILEQCLTR